MEAELRPMVRGDLSAAVAVAARAFHDDPLFNWFEPDLVRQMRELPALMNATLLDTLPHAETLVATIDGRVKGVAGWVPPGKYPRTTRAEVLFNLRAAPALVRIGRRLPAAVRLLTEIDRHHVKVEHWYLALLAVDPEFQGRGLGRLLTEAVLARADAEGLPAYLETQKESNVAWYAKAGFEVHDTIHLRDPGSPMMWTMLRPVRDPT